MIGIYCIEHIESGKKYIGKSINVNSRLTQHKYHLTRKNRSKKATNRYLYNAVQKYGWDAFNCYVLQTFDCIDEELIAYAELCWIELLMTTHSQFGYNLRIDSASKMIVHDETRKLQSQIMKGVNNPNFGNSWSPEAKQRMSEIKKAQHSNGSIYGDEWKTKLSEASKTLWSDEDKKHQMAAKVSKSKSCYKFYEYDKNTNELLNVWESMGDIIKAHPDYHNIAIYSVCNGHKKSYRGSVWKKELKI